MVILGRGPAGLSAALTASRLGLETVVVGSDAGSALSRVDRFSNFPSFVSRHSTDEDHPEDMVEEEELNHGGGGAR